MRLPISLPVVAVLLGLLSSLPLPTASADTTTTFTATGLPQNIPATASMVPTLHVGTGGSVTDVSVTLSITFPTNGALHVSLESPEGRGVDLVTAGEASGANFTNTVFSDGAATPFSSGSAPYTGSFRPSGYLSAFNAGGMGGNWKLHVQNSGGNTGALTAWSLTIKYGPAPYSLSGTVKQLGIGFAGVTMTLDWAGTPLTTTTAADGTYSFTGLEAGSYQVFPNMASCSFDPVFSFAYIIRTNLAGVDFTATCTGPAQIVETGLRYPTIQSAINAAIGGQHVQADPGTYPERINFGGKAITVESTDVNNPAATTIDGGKGGSVVTFASGEGAGSVLTGFKITNGSGTLYGGKYCGGGIYCQSSSPTIQNCAITGNTVADFGGGIECSQGSPAIQHCTISGNSAESGGGILCSSASATVQNCTMSGNSASTSGGGIQCDSRSCAIQNCTFSGNGAPAGGGICCLADSSTIHNTIVAFSTSGGGIYAFSLLQGPSVTYCDVYQNAGGDYINMAQAGTGCISVDPLFANKDGGDFRLKSKAGRWNGTGWALDTGFYSPCIDAGQGAAGGEPDPNGGIINMGFDGGTQYASKTFIPYSISGTVKSGGTGLDGVTMTLSGDATTTTSGGGLYSFTGLDAGTYTVTPTPPAPKHFSPTSTGVTVGPSAANVDFAIAPPAAPTMTAEPQFTAGLANTVSWGAVADADAYYVEWSTTNFGAAVGNSGWITTTSATAGNLTDGHYYFRVKARNAGGEGGWSSVVFSTQDASPPTSSVTAPTANQYALSFPVTWTCADATSGVAFTRLYYSSDGGANYHQFGGNFTGTSTSFTSPDGYGTYSLYTRATDTVGNAEGAPGAADASFRVIAAPLAPSMTAEPAYTKGGSNTVAWGAVADADAYYVEWSTTNFGAAVGSSGWTAGTNATATGLGDGAKYCYRVKARNGGGESGWSNVVSSTQDACAPSSCVCPLADQANLSFPISWTAADAVSGVGCTHLYYRVNGGPLAQFGGDWVGTSATFTSPAGPGCYSFYTCADDRVGNCEGPPTTPDLTIQVGVGNVLTWNPVTHNLKLGPVDVAASGWYNLAKPAGAQAYITVSGAKAAGNIGGALSKYDANGGTHTDAVTLQPANSLTFQWQLRNGALYTLTESSAVGSSATSAMYSSATNKTMIGATTKPGAWELTQTFTPPASVAVGSQQFVP